MFATLGRRFSQLAKRLPFGKTLWERWCATMFATLGRRFAQLASRIHPECPQHSTARRIHPNNLRHRCSCLHHSRIHDSVHVSFTDDPPQAESITEPTPTICGTQQGNAIAFRVILSLRLNLAARNSHHGDPHAGHWSPAKFLHLDDRGGRCTRPPQVILKNTIFWVFKKCI